MNRSTPQYNPAALTAALMLVPLLLATPAKSQGTLKISFDVLPAGQEGNVGIYYESGMSFAPIGPGNVALAGPGMPNHPDNGTGYLEIPDGNLSVSFTNTPTRLFSLVAFDAAEFDGFGPQTLTVVGYQLHIMAPTTTVTNYFTVNTLTSFQTFYPDSSFQNIYRVDVLNARWSLDNLVVSGVPEPSATAFLILGSASVFVFPRLTRNGRKK